ncbi:MAG: hypothetical protein Q8Q39_02625 [bacterium]|nr:hypothetical protein [bacterium]
MIWYDAHRVLILKEKLDFYFSVIPRSYPRLSAEAPQINADINANKRGKRQP